MRLAAVASAAVLSLAASACSRSSADAPASAQPGRPRLVFFMNPNGVPCQLQDDVLRRMPDLPSRAELVYVRTTVADELPEFRRYGIRGLPTLVVTDASGRELRRATPGVQTDAQVRALLGP
jgi:thioredoxin 1